METGGNCLHRTGPGQQGYHTCPGQLPVPGKRLETGQHDTALSIKCFELPAVWSSYNSAVDTAMLTLCAAQYSSNCEKESSLLLLGCRIRKLSVHV